MNTPKSALPGFERVDHIAMTVPDLNEAVRFYGEVFGLSELYRLGPLEAAKMPRMSNGRDWTQAHINVPGAVLTIAMMGIEGTSLMLELFQYDSPVDRPVAPPRNHYLGGHHIAFKVSNIDVAAEYLSANGCKLMEGPVILEDGPSAGLKFRYVLDPWGNQLELVEYVSQAWMKTSR
jgi:catechol 2,3-dioxygenase-like lactoylglutathione lyase family enzyme